MEEDYSTMFQNLAIDWIPKRCDLLNKGYYINFRTGTNNYFKAVWFDFNGFDKIIIRMFDGKYRNIYLSKVKGISINFFEKFRARSIFKSDEDFLKKELNNSGFKVKIEDLYELMQHISFSQLDFSDLLGINFECNGKVYTLALKGNANFSFNFRNELYNCYRALISIDYILKNYSYLGIKEFNKALRKFFPFNNRICLYTGKYSQ